MHTSSRVLIGLLLLSAASLVLADETTPPSTETLATLPESSREVAPGNALEPTETAAEPVARAADIAPTSWSNVKALWG